MKRLILLITVLLAGPFGFCQAGPQDPYAEKLVASFVSPPGTPIFYSMQVKAVRALGDRAAIGAIRVLGDQPPTAQQIERILSILKMAYENPEGISTDWDREPKATLLLLEFLQSSQVVKSSKKLSTELNEARTYVQRQVEDYKRQRDHH